MSTEPAQENTASFNIFKQEPISISKITAKALDDMSRTETSEVQKIASNQIKLLTEFYDQSLSQAHRSFVWALIASIVGLLFLMAAIAFQVFKNGDVAIISLIGGALIEFIAAVNFYLYGKTTSQLNLFHGRLEVTQRFLLANSLCENLGDDYRDQTRAQLISQLAIDSTSGHTGGPSGGGRRRRHERVRRANDSVAGNHPAAANPE